MKEAGAAGGHRLRAFVLAALVTCALGILNGQDDGDITQDPGFNCRWYGGSDPKLECNCLTGTEEFVIRQNSIPPYDVAAIIISGCGRITMEANAIAEMRSLRAITLEHINSLELRTDSLAWLGVVRVGEHLVDYDARVPTLRIRISTCGIVAIASGAIHGRIAHLEIIDSVVGRMAPFAVSRLQQTQHVRLVGSEFSALAAQSFKKFTTRTLLITDCTFTTIPSRAFYDLDALDAFQLANITVRETVQPSAFVVNAPRRFELVQSRIDTLAGGALRVATLADVLVRDNVFNHTASGAFRGITLRNHEEDDDDVQQVQTLRFERNVFATLSRDALAVDGASFRAEFVGVQIGEVCACDALERYLRHGENTLELSCIAPSATEWMSVESFRRAHCGLLDTRAGTAYVIVGVCVLALLLAGVAVGGYFLRLQRRRSYGDHADGKLSMIVPDGRTYRETELHVIVERADMLTTDL